MRFLTLPGAATHRDISDILCAVGKSLFLFVFVATAFLFAFRGALPAAPQAPAAPEPAQAPPPAQTPLSATPPTAPPPLAPTGPVIVLDPAHGGTDAGARGESAVEKDVVLQLARSVRAALERQGYRVVMTRDDDSNPSYDDRAAMANTYRDAVFVSFTRLQPERSARCALTTSSLPRRSQRPSCSAPRGRHRPCHLLFGKRRSGRTSHQAIDLRM